MLARCVMMDRIATMSWGSGLHMNIVKFSYKDTTNWLNLVLPIVLMQTHRGNCSLSSYEIIAYSSCS